MTLSLNNLENRLAKHKNNNLYRHRIALHSVYQTEVIHQQKKLISFSSNDYLGLAKHPALIKAFQNGAEKYGVGSGASQLITGYSPAHQALEEAFAEFLQRERAILFSNGYMANLGILQALTKATDIIYEDKLNHASLIDAGLLSTATLKRYKHLDLQHLAQQLSLSIKPETKKFIVSDGVFSMNGNLARLPDLVALAKKYHSYLMIDDAHGIGILGKNGAGTLEHFALSQEDVSLLICPLGKAFGCYGAIVAGSNLLIESLLQFARTFIYTTAIPPALACASLTSLHLIKTESWRRQKLTALVTYFKKVASKNNLTFLPSDTAIQCYRVNDAAQAIALSEKLLQQGFLVMPIRPPTVPPNQACLRITLSCLHEEKQIEQLLDCIHDSQP